MESVQAILTFLARGDKVMPTASGFRQTHADAGMLYELDAVAQQIVQMISVHQREALEGTPVIFASFDRSLVLHRHVTMAELQRHRRQFVKVNSLYPPDSKAKIGSAFVDYLANQI